MNANAAETAVAWPLGKCEGESHLEVVFSDAECFQPVVVEVACERAQPSISV